MIYKNLHFYAIYGSVNLPPGENNPRLRTTGLNSVSVIGKLCQWKQNLCPLKVFWIWPLCVKKSIW